MNFDSIKNNDFLLFKEAAGHRICQLLQNEDNTIEEIMRNPDGTVWVERKGVGEELIGNIQSDVNAKKMIEIVASSMKRICNEKKPTLSGEIPGLGYRFQGFMPTTVDGYAWNIRVPSPFVFTLEDYATAGIISVQQKNILEQFVKEGKNILVAGATRSGKTTFLNGLLVESSKQNNRHLLIEDTRELKCSAKNKVHLRSNEYADQADLLEAAMRASPKRIIIGEVRRGKVAEVYLMSANTGHEGILCTIHCKSALDSLYRLEELLAEAGLTPVPASIIRAVNVVVYIEAARISFQRKVKEIVEVKGYKNGEYELVSILEN